MHPFSTVLTCNECNGSMSYRKKYEGYKCSDSQRGGGRCTAHSVKEQFLKATIKNNTVTSSLTSAYYYIVENNMLGFFYV